MSYITTLLTIIDTQVNHYTFDAYHAVAASMYGTLIILLVIYFAGLGWLVLRGLIPLTPMAMAWHMLKACIIVSLALRWDYFSFFIVNFFTKGPEHLISILLNKITPNSITSTTIVIDGLAKIWQSGCNVFANIWREMGSEFGLGTVFGLIGYAAVTTLTAVALFYIVMAKIALSVLLVLAPFILPLFLWANTRALFNGWLRLVIKWALVPLFIYPFIALFMSLIQGQIDAMAQAQPVPSTASISAFVLICMIAIATFWQAAKMTTEIARGISLHDFSLGNKNPIPGMLIKKYVVHNK